MKITNFKTTLVDVLLAAVEVCWAQATGSFN
jgi:hypothetical protein